MCDYQCTSVSFIKLRIESNRIEKSIRQRESNRIIFPRIGML